VKSLEALELAKEKALQVNTNMATMVPLELECTVPVTEVTGAHYKTPKLLSGLALALLQKHRSENHSPPAPSLFAPLKDSVKLPVVLSTTTKDNYGLFTESPPVGNKVNGNRDNKSSRQEEAAGCQVRA
jgi:hypothetical protein